MRLTLRFVPALIVAASLAPLLLLPAPGMSTPLYAARTGLACANCHFDPNGGGPRNAFGFAYAKNRHSTESETEGMFKDLDLTNKVSEQLPLYFGVNSRLMALADDANDPPDGVDRFGFFGMETQLHMAFQPHPKLTLEYTTDGFGTENVGGVRVTREAWGMLGSSTDRYLRAGIFRVPFGLRMDDHTVATRNGNTEFQPERAFVLPYDPRISDQGVEFGGTRGEWQGRLAYTNGTSFVLSGGPNPRLHAQAFSGKLVYADEKYQVGLSGHDEWVPANGAESVVRASRWGTYALTRRGNVSLIGEVVAGTDKVSASAAGAPYENVNKLGYFIEGDYQLNRATNFRLRYNRLEGYRVAGEKDEADQAAYNQYALEGEVVPMPFAEIRWTLRLLDPVAEKDVTGTTDRDTEKQAYIQFHFSY